MGNCAYTEKWDKQKWHRRWRRVEREKLGVSNNLENHLTAHRYEVSNAYDFNKDGKHYLGNSLNECWDEKWMRK